MKRKWTALRSTRVAAIAALALGALLASGRTAAARPPGGRACGGGGPHMLEKLERDLGGLGLEQKQLDAAYAVIDQARKDRRALDGELRTAHERMRDLLDQDQPDADTVTAQADTIGGLMTQARKIDLRAIVQVRNMLTPEQRKKVDEARERFGHRGPRDPEL